MQRRLKLPRFRRELEILFRSFAPCELKLKADR
jgi:hypothetical protein